MEPQDVLNVLLKVDNFFARLPFHFLQNRRANFLLKEIYRFMPPTITVTAATPDVALAIAVLTFFSTPPGQVFVGAIEGLVSKVLHLVNKHIPEIPMPGAELAK